MPHGILAGFFLIVSLIEARKYTCYRPLDIVFNLDASGSVQPTQWTSALKFIADIALAFDFGPQLTQMGMVQFSAASTVSIPLNLYQNATLFAQDVRQQKQIEGTTNTWLGVDTSAQLIATEGRLPENGAAHMIITITDGQSQNAGKTAAACADAWGAGDTLVLITIGFAVNPVERNGFICKPMEGCNNDLDFPLEDWAGIDADTGLVANLTSLVCNAPVVPDNLSPINTTLPCNASLLVVFYPNVIGPLNLMANISIGSITLCFSYVDDQPSPEDAAVSPFVRCSFLREGSNADIATVTAYPTNTSLEGEQTLYVSVTAGEAGNECGGNFVLTPYYCSTLLALNVTRVPGDGAGVTFNTTWLGDPDMPRCTECPTGTARLGDSPSSPFWGICANVCAGRAQFTTLDASGVETCHDCSASCSACAAPGTPRTCVACPYPPEAGGGLLQNGVDPALTSPFRGQYGGTPSSLHSTGDALLTGRCVSSCPPKYRPNDSGSGLDESVCVGEPKDLAAASTTVLASVCLPAAAYPPRWGGTCKDLQGGPLVESIATSLAIAWEVPLPALFLHSCMDFPLLFAPLPANTSRSSTGIPSSSSDVGTRFAWGYAQPSPQSANAVAVPYPYYTLEDSTGGGACNCSSVLTFSLVLAVAAPGETPTPASWAAGVTTMSIDPAVLSNRSQAAQSMLKAALTRTRDAGLGSQMDPTVLPIAATCASSARREWVSPVLLGVCANAGPATLLPQAADLLPLNAASLCGPAMQPSPSLDPGASLAVRVVSGLGIFVGVAGFLAACIVYCRFRARRREIVKMHQRKMRKTVRYRASLSSSRNLALAVNAGLLSGDVHQADEVGVGTPRTRAAAARLPVSSLGRDVQSLGSNPGGGTTALALPHAGGGSRRERKAFGPTSSFKIVGGGPVLIPEELELEPQPEPLPPPGVTIVPNPLSAASVLDWGAPPAPLHPEPDPAPARTPVPSVILVPAARPPISSLAGAVLEFLVPGSVTMGMSLVDDGVVAEPCLAGAPPLGTNVMPQSSGNDSRHVRVMRQMGLLAPVPSSSRELALPGAVRVVRHVDRVETVQLRPVAHTRGREGADIEVVRAAAAAAAEAVADGTTEGGAAKRAGFVRQYSVVNRVSVVEVEERQRGRVGVGPGLGGAGPSGITTVQPAGR